MTPEQIHDALTLLPSDLIAEADQMRSRQPRVLAWKRYAAMAACFALICCAGWYVSLIFAPMRATETLAEAEAAPMMQPAMAGDTAAPAEGSGANHKISEDLSPQEEASAAADQAQLENTMKRIEVPSVTLTVSFDQESQAIPAQGYYLFALQEDGTRQDLKLDTNAAIPKLETSSEVLELAWSQEPDQLSAWYYEQTTAASSLACSVDSLRLLPGSHTYYLNAHWEEYTIRYAIHVTLLENP